MFQYFEHVEEMEWAIEVCAATGKTVAASMCIGPDGDLHGVSAEECAVRMAKAGARVGESNVAATRIPLSIIIDHYTLLLNSVWYP